jgi:hypothetical protein
LRECLTERHKRIDLAIVSADGERLDLVLELLDSRPVDRHLSKEVAVFFPSRKQAGVCPRDECAISGLLEHQREQLRSQRQNRADRGNGSQHRSHG